MKWLLTLAIALPTYAQPTLDAVRDAKTPDELIAAVHEWTRGRQMGVHTATFDGGITTTGSMTTTFDRDTATYDWTGASETAATTSAVDTPRYGGDVVVYGARTIETVSGTAGSWRPYAAGLDSSGLPVVVVNFRGTPTIYVYRDGSTASVLNSKALLGGANKPAATLGDILAGEDDEEADYTHGPRGAVCLPGIILLNCCTFKYDGLGDRTDAAQYVIDGVSLCYSTDNGATWQLAWRSGNLNGVTPPTDYGSEWSITAVSHERDSTNDDFWVTVTSYASGGDRGADTFVCRLTGGSGAWTISNAHHFNHTNGSGTITHAHYAVTFEDPNNTSGLKLICEIGDTATDNRTDEYLCTSKSGFLTGGAADSGATNVVSSGTNWSGPVSINGQIGATEADEWMSSQTISYAPGPNGGWYAGVDEGLGGPILYATVPATDGARVNWQDAHAITGNTNASGSEHNHRCFTLNAWEYDASNPAVAAFVSPGNGWDTGFHDAGRILYKDRGATAFGVVYAPQDEASMGSQLRPVLSPGGYIWFGTGNDQGLRRFTVPSGSEARTQRAVYAGPGGVNEVLATIVQQNAPGAGNTVTIGTDTAPVQPPFAGTNLHFTVGTTASGIGIWRITDNAISKTHTTLDIQMLIYQDTAAGDSDADCYFRCRFYSLEGGNVGTLATGFMGPDRIETRGQFRLLTFTLENGVDWDLTGVVDADGLRILCQMQMSGATVHPGEWWMWFTGVYEDISSPPSYLVPAATSGDAESLSLSGFTCGSQWTAYAVGILGGDTGRDCQYQTANTFREFATLYESETKHIQFAWDADDQVRIVCTDGGSTDTETLTGLPKFRRGDPVIFAISCDGTDYNYALSVAGTIAQTGTIASANAIVNPVQFLLGQDDDGTVREATRWLYAAVHDDMESDSGLLPGFVRDLRVPEGIGSGGLKGSRGWRTLPLKSGGRFRY